MASRAGVWSQSSTATGIQEEGVDDAASPFFSDAVEVEGFERASAWDPASDHRSPTWGSRERSASLPQWQQDQTKGAPDFVVPPPHPALAGASPVRSGQILYNPTGNGSGDAESHVRSGLRQPSSLLSPASVSTGGGEAEGTVEECDWEAYEPRIPEGEEDKGFAPVSARWRRAALLQHMEQGLEALPPVEQAQLARAREIESREEARVRQEEARANQLQQQQDAAAAAAAQQQQQQQQQQDEAAASAQRWDSAPTATPPPPPPPRKSTDESTYHAQQQYVEYAGVGPHCFHDAPPRRQPSMTEKHAQQVSAAAAAAAAAVAQLQVAHAQLQAAQHTDQSLALPPQMRGEGPGLLLSQHHPAEGSEEQAQSHAREMAAAAYPSKSLPNSLPGSSTNLFHQHAHYPNPTGMYGDGGGDGGQGGWLSSTPPYQPAQGSSPVSLNAAIGAVFSKLAQMQVAPMAPDPSAPQPPFPPLQQQYQHAGYEQAGYRAAPPPPHAGYAAGDGAPYHPSMQPSHLSRQPSRALPVEVPGHAGYTDAQSASGYAYARPSPPQEAGPAELYVPPQQTGSYGNGGGGVLLQQQQQHQQNGWGAGVLGVGVGGGKLGDGGEEGKQAASITQVEKLKREAARLQAEVERLQAEVGRQKSLRETERTEFADSKERMKASWAADREDFARVKQALKKKNAEHHIQSGRLSQAVKEADAVARGLRELCAREGFTVPAHLDGPGSTAVQRREEGAWGDGEAEEEHLSPDTSSSPDADDRRTSPQQARAADGAAPLLPNGNGLPPVADPSANAVAEQLACALSQLSAALGSSSGATTSPPTAAPPTQPATQAAVDPAHVVSAFTDAFAKLASTVSQAKGG